MGVPLAKPRPGTDEPPVLVAAHLHKAFMCDGFSLPVISHQQATEYIATEKYFELQIFQKAFNLLPISRKCSKSHKVY